MKKGVAYIIVLILIAAALFLLYPTDREMTGYAVFSEYENQTSCESAGYVWENLTEQNCTNVTIYVNETIDCEPCLEYEDINGTQGECINWSSCINETSTIEEECVDIVIGGQCVGDVCGTDFLELCLDETDCTDAGGYWYNDACNAEAELICSDSNLDLCDETDCTGAGGYWYDATCNEDVEPSCSNDLTHCDETDCVSEGSGYWYNDNCNAQEEEVSTEESSSAQVILAKPEIVVSDIQDFTASPGSSKEVKWIAGNAGTIPASVCRVLSSGDYSEWVTVSDESVNLISGEEKEFMLDIVVPEEVEEGEYLLSVSLACSRITILESFTIDVEEKQIEFELISASRTRDDRVRVLYSLEELSGEDQEVELGFSLLNEDDQEIAAALENRSLNANSSRDFRVNIEINESLLPVNETTNETIESELSLVVSLDSQLYSSSVMEKITLGAPIGGFAIFEGVGAGEAIIFLIVVLVLVFVLVFARRMRKQGKTLKDLFNRDTR